MTDDVMQTYAKEINKRVYKPKTIARVYSGFLDNIWSVDLADFQDLASINNDMRYVFVCVDCWSRFAWCIPMKSKTEDDSWDALETILKSKRKPNKIWSDKGTEFYNKKWKAELKKRSITQYSTYGQSKSAIAERFIRTLKEKIWFYFTENQTRVWVDVLDKIVKEYNDTIHSGIKMTPTEASKVSNQYILNTREVQKDMKEKDDIPLFKIDDWVRISRKKEIFEKGFHPSWSFEVFQITKVDVGHPCLYSIKDFYGEPIEGRFYESELQLTNNHDVFMVENIEGKRTIDGEKQLLVKYMGYKTPVWTRESDISGDKIVSSFKNKASKKVIEEGRVSRKTNKEYVALKNVKTVEPSGRELRSRNKVSYKE